MAKRNGEFIGAYVPKKIKEYLKRRALIERKTVSDTLLQILQKEINNDFKEQVSRALSKKDI